MKQCTEHILAMMREMARHPTLFAGNPLVVSGMATALAWAAIAQEFGIPIQDVCLQERMLLEQATADVPRPKGAVPALCSESCCCPDNRESYDALQRHLGTYVELLEALLTAGIEEGRRLDEAAKHFYWR